MAAIEHSVVDKEDLIKRAQEAFLETLVRVENRKNRAWLTSDLIVVQEALHAY